jgi:hypothetical protein
MGDTSGLQSSGPYIQVAAIVESVLQEANGVVSLVRLIDRITQTTEGPDAPDEMPPVRYPIQIVLMLKSGTALGRHSVTLRSEAPTGQSQTHGSTAVHFEGQERGINLFFNTVFTTDTEGLYWFDVLLDEAILLTRIPLRVVYQPIRH